MVSIEKISQKFIQLENYLGLLKEISKESEEAFLKNQIIIWCSRKKSLNKLRMAK